MSVQRIAVAFSCNADASAHDRTIYLQQTDEETVKVGARYKNSEPNHLYELEMDADDLRDFARLCEAIANQLDGSGL